MKHRITRPCMANQIGFLVISFVLLSSAINFIACKICKFEEKYKCGIEDCNCRPASQDAVEGSNYRRFLDLIKNLIRPEDEVCDRCDVFCKQEKHVNCEHGTCGEQKGRKGCICDDCWSGKNCSKYRNRQPEFKERYYDSEIKENANVGDEILKVSAFDADLETCVDKKNCPCGRIKYSISKGNEDGLFNINADTGVISLAKKLSDQYHSQITLSILAENEADLNIIEDNQIDKPSAIVGITVTTDDDAVRVRRSLHHRTRRSVTTYNALVVTFEAVTNQTFFAAGCTINYRLHVVQNQSASPKELSSITVQFSSENLKLSEKYSLNISNSPVVEDIGNSLDAGKVQINITNSLQVNGSMEIKFNGSVPATLDPLTLLQVAFTMNATATPLGQVIYGPKYSTELYTTYPQITLTRTNQGVVEVEKTLHYNVEVTLPFFGFSFTLAITTILNDFRFLSIENVTLGAISDSVNADIKNPTPKKYTGSDDITSRVTLNFSNVKGEDRNQSNNTIKLSFSVKVNDHHSLMNGSKFWIGIGSYAGSIMLGVTQDFIQIYKDEPYLFAEIKAINITDPEVKEYFINDEVQFSWNVKHGNGSYEAAKNVTVLFYIPTSLVYLSNSNKDGNEMRVNDSTSGEDIRKFTPNIAGNFSLGSILTGIIRVKVSKTVTPLVDLNVGIGIRYQTTEGEDRPFKMYKPDPGYIAGTPEFSVAVNPNITKINIGQVVEITLKIKIERMNLDGNLFVYLPDRKINSTIMRFVISESFNQITYGVNIDADIKNATPSYSSSDADETYENSAELNFGQIKNKNMTKYKYEDNTITMAFKVVLEDNENVKNLSNYPVNIGMKTSNQTVWVSKINFIANIAPSRRPKVEIIAASNGSDSLNQGSVVEYNFTISHKNDSDAHAQDVEVIWMLPVYIKYRKLTQNQPVDVHHQLMLTKLRDNVKFSLKKLDFGEKYFVSFTVEIDPKNTKTSPGKYYAVTPVALSYKKNQTYFEPLIPISIAFTVSEKTQKSENSVPAKISEMLYNRGYLVDMSRSIVYICSVSLKRDKPSCFWTNTNGNTWQAVHVSVINIIGIDNHTKTLYGIGNNKKSYMKYSPDEEKWFSMLPEMWGKILPTLSLNNTIKIEDGYENESDPKKEKQRDMENGEIWGANKLGLFHSKNGAKWSRKACWDCFQ
ncbi:uncharacterized protein LOC114528088 [Dendronephthya gigantea]|uniref:uncharacterized protein LOC114528088 n=1 Tax=Dendronephthya gigantea TaxID=151771 RepID=UPI00106CEC0D|nr:uncharacterized protein LOC114528088 [Dendronephthya gigantea]